MKTALLVNEAGYGLGHLKRLSTMAAQLRSRGFRVILSSFRLSYLDHVKDDFDEILPAPGWPGLKGEKGFYRAHNLKQPINSFAGILSSFGMADPRVVANHLRAWDGILRLVRPEIIIGDYAPGAMIAASGRVPCINVGNGFTVPAIYDGRFVTYRQEAEDDRKLCQTIRNALSDGMRLAGHQSSTDPLLAIRGDKAFPICYRAFDPARGRRVEPVVAPAIPLGEPAEMEHGPKRICMYFGPDIEPCQHVLNAIGKVYPKSSIYIHANSRTAVDVSPFEIRDRLFTVSDIATGSRLFIHHGGLGISQICATAGVPQLAIFHDVEKWLNAQSIATHGAGIGLHLRDANRDRIYAAVEKISGDSFGVAAKNWAGSLLNECVKIGPEKHIISSVCAEFGL